MVKTKDMLELVKSHYSSNKNKFEKVLSQVIEHENEKGSKATAQKLRNIQQNGSNKLIPISTALGGKIQFVKATKTLDSLFQKETVVSAFSQIQLEYSKEEMLLNYGLKPIKKIMFLGPSGTGKTMSAEIVANLLDMPLGIIHTEQLISSRLGETSKNLAHVFEEMERNEAVYFIDEFDSLAKSRDIEDVGEMSRIVNTLLLQIERSENYIIVASNYGDLFDKALMRRFDLRVDFEEPNSSERLSYIEQKLEKEFKGDYPLEKLVNHSAGLNYSAIEKEIMRLKKHAILQEEMPLSEKSLNKAFVQIKRE